MWCKDWKGERRDSRNKMCVQEWLAQNETILNVFSLEQISKLSIVLSPGGIKVQVGEVTYPEWLDKSVVELEIEPRSPDACFSSFALTPPFLSFSSLLLNPFLRGCFFLCSLYPTGSALPPGSDLHCYRTGDDPLFLSPTFECWERPWNFQSEWIKTAWDVPGHMDG